MNKFTSWHEFSDILVNVPLPQICGATDVSDGEWDIELRFKLINHITGSLFFYVIGFFFPLLPSWFGHMLLIYFHSTNKTVQSLKIILFFKVFFSVIQNLKRHCFMSLRVAFLFALVHVQVSFLKINFVKKEKKDNYSS